MIKLYIDVDFDGLVNGFKFDKIIVLIYND